MKNDIDKLLNHKRCMKERKSTANNNFSVIANLGTKLKYKNIHRQSLNSKLKTISSDMVSLNDLLRSQLKDIKSADQTVTIQMKNHEDLNSKVEMIKNKIESKNVKIQQAFEEIKITENCISNLKENIKQANNSIIELSIQDTIKQQRIQELLSQIAKKNLKTTTPLKQKKKVRSSLKGCRNSQARTVSTMTPSTAGENSNRKLIIKRLEMSKLKNSATVDTEISTPEYNQIPLVSPKYYSNNCKSFQSSEYQGSMYGKSWDPSSSRNSILGARKTSQKNIPLTLKKTR